MWICFNDAFVSAVEDSYDKRMLKVRARKRSHLKTLFPGRPIHTSSESDYTFRVIVPKEDFAKLVADRVEAIDYGNFKNSVKDDDLHDLYSRFWNLHWLYQRRQSDKNAERSFRRWLGGGRRSKRKQSKQGTLEFHE